MACILKDEIICGLKLFRVVTQTLFPSEMDICNFTTEKSECSESHSRKIEQSLGVYNMREAALEGLLILRRILTSMIG